MASTNRLLQSTLYYSVYSATHNRVMIVCPSKTQ